MIIRTLTFAAVASLLVASIAFAEGGNSASATATAGATTTTTAAPADTPGTAKTPWPYAGEKKYKDRINVVARKPLRHDIEYIDSKDRGSWSGYTIWQGVRDDRPLVARKTMGFHEPRPHRTRKEKVLMLSRGPIKGPAGQE